MAINRTTLFQWIEEAEGGNVYTDVVIKAPGNGENRYRLYAVTAVNATMSDHNHPYGPAIRLGYTNNRAAAGAMAGKFRRWLEEYNNDRY